MTTLPPDLLPIIDELLSLLPRFCRGEYGIALGGAHAKGVADAASDIDLYLFARQVLPNDARTRLCGELSAARAIVSWGETEPFVQAGTDFYLDQNKIECWLRNADHIARTIADCRSGVVRHDYITWTVMGFYNHCALSDLHKMIPLDDPFGILAGWQAEVREYPPKLRAAIIGSHMKAARFWPGNFHYLSAVERCDVLYVTGIVQQVVHNLIQVIFALNRTYFPGEKKLGAALDRLAIRPQAFTERVERLVSPGAAPDVVRLRLQSREMAELVGEVEALVTQAAE